MPRKQPIARVEYVRRVRVLREFGFSPSYRIGRLNTNGAKAAVTRVWEKHRFFLNPKAHTQPVKFRRAGKAELKIARTVVSPEAMTPGGYFLMVPRGVKKRDYDLKIRAATKTRYAVVVEWIRGKQLDVVVRPDWAEMLRNPRGHIRRMVERQKLDAPKRVVRGRLKKRKLIGAKIMVGGMESHGTLITPGVLEHYADDLFDRFVGSEERYDTKREYIHRAKAFSEKFQIRFMYGN